MKFGTDIVNEQLRNIVYLDEAEIELLNKANELLKVIDSSFDYKSNPKMKPIEAAYICKEMEDTIYHIRKRIAFQM